MKMSKREAALALVALRSELQWDDPHLEEVLFQVFSICESREIRFTLSYSPGKGYTARCGIVRIGTNESMRVILLSAIQYLIGVMTI